MKNNEFMKKLVDLYLDPDFEGSACSSGSVMIPNLKRDILQEAYSYDFQRSAYHQEGVMEHIFLVVAGMATYFEEFNVPEDVAVICGMIHDIGKKIYYQN